MATDKPRFSVTFTDDSFRKIQKYKEENNISTQSKAVARLVELAIGEIESERSTKKPPSTAEAAPGEKDLELFDKLLDGLISTGRIVEGKDISTSQAEVLSAICRILDATF